MNRDEIIKMAREAGFVDGAVDIIGFDGFANFAALVAAAEREVCAEMVEGMDVQHPKYIAAAIRERGEE